MSSPDALRRGQPNSRRATRVRPFLVNVRCRARMPVALDDEASQCSRLKRFGNSGGRTGKVKLLSSYDHEDTIRRQR